MLPLDLFRRRKTTRRLFFRVDILKSIAEISSTEVVAGERFHFSPAEFDSDHRCECPYAKLIGTDPEFKMFRRDEKESKRWRRRNYPQSGVKSF